MNLNTAAGAPPATDCGRSPESTDTGNSWLIDPDHPSRPRVEDFIARRFHDIHGARIAYFMPTLLALQGEDGDIRATVGVRDAGSEPLFLEYYLDRPVEAVLAAKSEIRPPPSRSRIAEIGNLASVDRSASRRLFGILSAHLASAGFEWAVFTGCGALIRMFDTLGIQTFNLGRALQSRLPVDQQTWGGYYEDNPQVVAGRVCRGLDVFRGPQVPVASGVPS
jgi:hypothetical protein